MTDTRHELSSAAWGWPLLMGLGLLVAALAAGALLVGFDQLSHDAAYLEAVQARALAQKGSFALFGGAGGGTGVASPLYTGLVAFFVLLGFSATAVMHGLSALFAALSAVLVARMASAKGSPRVAVLVSLSFVLCPPVFLAAMGGDSAAMGLFLTTLVLYLLAMQPVKDGALRAAAVSAVLALAMLARPETAVLAVALVLADRSSTGLTLGARGLAALAAVGLAAVFRTVLLGSVADGLFQSVVAGRGLLGAFSGDAFRPAELLLGISAYPLMGFLESGLTGLSMGLAGLAVMAFNFQALKGGPRPPHRMLCFSWLVFGPLVLGALLAEGGVGMGMRYFLWLTPAYALAGVHALNRLSAPEVTFKPLVAGVITLLLAAGVLTAALLHTPLIGPYWTAQLKNHALPVLAGLTAAGMGVLLVAAARRHLARVGAAVVATGVLLSLALMVPLALHQHGEMVRQRHMAGLLDRMSLFVRDGDQVGAFRSGLALYLRPRHTRDLSGRVESRFHVSRMAYARDLEKFPVSVASNCVPEKIGFIICDQRSECGSLLMEPDWRFALQTGSIALYRHKPVDPEAFEKRYGRPDTEMTDRPGAAP